MTDTFRSLEDITKSYTVFEPDQVLTPGQLNGVASYLDDQERLTRVALLGVGIACGLWPSHEGNRVRLSHGVGTTTDGDVFFMPQDTLYDRYKSYDKSAPKYPPFYSGKTMIAAFELVREGESDSRAKPLTGFNGAERFKLEGMAAVLYVETYLHDEDLCTGTDCDNRGKDSIHAVKLLLVEPKSAAALAGWLETPHAAARSLIEPIVIARPRLPHAFATEAELAAVYRKACDGIHQELVHALDALYGPCKWFLEDFMPVDPGPEWRNGLDRIRSASQDRGIQYYYDFLKDLAETYNAFRDVLFGDTAVCCPYLGAFPKHLVLGSLERARRAAGSRTGFYPSPMVSERFEQRAHARFLIRKLDALITLFEIPRDGGIRITPSAFEDRALEERAIPFYYRLDEQLPVYRAWSYRLSKRGMERYNYSYSADQYAEGAAQRPLDAQIGPFDFFRIEGHIGLQRTRVEEELPNRIARDNLPIALEFLRVDKPPKGWRPPVRNPNLFDLRHMLLAEVATQLNDATKFGQTFVQQVKRAAGTVITDADNDNVPIVGTAQTKTELLSGHARSAMAKLAKDEPESGWQDDLARAVQTAAELNEALSPVTKKDFISPLDHLISGGPARWLGWVNELMADADGKDSTRAQLSEFLKEHAGLEHYAGVLRGGTFVLVCNEQDTVIADFMLPYNCCVRRAEPPKPPKLVPPVRPGIVFEKPIRLVPFPDKFRFDKFRDDFVKDLKKDVELRTNYFNVFKDTLGIVASARELGGPVRPGPLTADPMLDLHIAEAAWKTQKVDTLRTRLLDPGLDRAKRAAFEKQLESAETELAATVLTTTEYLASVGIAVTPGSDGAKALDAASAAIAKVSNIGALADLEKGLITLSRKASTTPEVKLAIGNLLSGRGIR